VMHPVEVAVRSVQRALAEALQPPRQSRSDQQRKEPWIVSFVRKPAGGGERETALRVDAAWVRWSARSS
jgi:hypothetical protein